MDVKGFKNQLYREYKEEIDLISKASIDEERNWQADIGVATDMFINYIDNVDLDKEEKGLFVNIHKAKERITELRKEFEIEK